jgi:hypothetical protein
MPKNIKLPFVVEISGHAPAQPVPRLPLPVPADITHPQPATAVPSQQERPKAADYLQLYQHPLPNSQPGLLRIVVEESIMCNNMEVAHTIEEAKFDDWLGIHAADHLRICIVRPIHAEEPKYPNPDPIWSEPEHVAPVTRQLDDIYKTLGVMRALRKVLSNPTPANMLAHYISDHYYDCMSGGMGITAAVLCRQLIQNLPALYWQTGNQGETLADFMRSTQKYASHPLPCTAPRLS